MGEIIRIREVFRSVMEDLHANQSIGRIGANFHKTIADIAIESCRCARKLTGLGEVALSGGVWQNQLLLELVREGLYEDGFVVYYHKQVPMNDGGLSLGQAVIANHVTAKQYSSSNAAAA